MSECAWSVCQADARALCIMSTKTPARNQNKETENERDGGTNRDRLITLLNDFSGAGCQLTPTRGNVKFKVKVVPEEPQSR